MNDDFSYLVKKLGRPAKAEAFDSDDAHAWKGKLPDALVEFWQECGIGMWRGGRMQSCRPDRYASLMPEVFRGDPQFAPERTHLIGFSAFGELFVWNEEFQDLIVDLRYLRARGASAEPDWQAIDPAIALAGLLASIEDKKSFDMFEDAPGTPLMFDRCVGRYGALELGECYGLFPALALGGVCRVENVRRVRALEHFAILAGLGRITLLRYEGARAISVREIGS